MQSNRFYKFIMLIEGVHKSISKLKLDTAPEFGVKSVHLLWVYKLYEHPEGLTAAELASQSMISRSLVSREIENLCERGFIKIHETAKGKRKNYNSQIMLTQKGEELAKYIAQKGVHIQNEVNKGISPEELSNFYCTLEKLTCNLQRIAQSNESYGQNS